MKTFNKLFIIISIFVAGHLNAQNANHPTISEVKVAYKSAPASSSTISAIQATPHATITLKPGGNAATIYLKIVNNTTNATVYEVNYALNSAIITSQTGEKLFENNNGVVFISSGSPGNLMPYTYQVYTKDSQANSTAIFSVIQ